MIQAKKIWKYGDDINTDYIFPGIHTYTLMSEKQMGMHAMEGYDLDFTGSAAAGDVIVAGKNWGCGSSREQAVKCIKARGISAIIAKSFSRIYYRNSLNQGLLIIACPAAADAIQADDHVSICMETNTIRTSKGDFQFPAYPEYVKNLVECGGLVAYIRKRLGLASPDRQE